MSDEKQIIDDAYAEVLHEVFATFVTNRVTEHVGEGGAKAHESAEEKFKRGVTIARETRDLAVKIIAQLAQP